MFINISNHPSIAWKEEQISEAQIYGEIMDIPFPNIPPQMDTEEMKSIVDYYIRKIEVLTIGKTEDMLIHVMGESVFSFMLIVSLLQKKYKVVASTTERIVSYEGEVKRTEFKFVRFREYKLE